MKALITGASSGIGREIALYLSDLGYDIIVVARNELALKELQREVKTKVEIVSMDLTDRVNCWKLHEMYKNHFDLFQHKLLFLSQRFQTLLLS